jgi:xylulokinase
VPALVLGATFGVRSTSVEVRDADTGELVATGAAQRPSGRAPGEGDDPTDWWQSLVLAVARAKQRDIAAISVCGARPGLVALDAAGAVLRPTGRWSGVDSAADAAELLERVGAGRWARLCGILPTPSTAITRLLWLRRTDPAAFDRIGAVLLPHDWLTYRLAGRPVTDRSSASTTACWSGRDERWATELLAQIDDRVGAAAWLDRVPAVLAPAARADWLAAPVFELLGLRGRPIVAAGASEPAAVAVALGLAEGEAVIHLADKTTVSVSASEPTADESGVVDGLADADGRFLPTVSAGGGADLAAAVALLLGTTHADLGDMALDAPYDPNAPVIVPAVGGRRGSIIAGLDASTSREALASAVITGVACSALASLERIQAAGGATSAAWLSVTGPGAAIPAHAQALADLAGMPVYVPPDHDLAAAGACVQAAAALTGAGLGDIASAWRLGDGPTYEPRSGVPSDEIRAAYAAEARRQRAGLG